MFCIKCMATVVEVVLKKTNKYFSGFYLFQSLNLRTESRFMQPIALDLSTLVPRLMAKDWAGTAGLHVFSLSPSFLHPSPYGHNLPTWPVLILAKDCQHWS